MEQEWNLWIQKKRENNTKHIDQLIIEMEREALLFKMLKDVPAEDAPDVVRNIELELEKVWTRKDKLHRRKKLVAVAEGPSGVPAG